MLGSHETNTKYLIFSKNRLVLTHNKLLYWLTLIGQVGANEMLCCTKLTEFPNQRKQNLKKISLPELLT